MTIYHADCAELFSDLPQVDLVLTDPPYPRKYDGCWTKLGAGSSQVLKNRAPLFTYCGHYQVPKVCADVGAYLTYWWLFIARNKCSPLIHMSKLRATFKPILAFYKGGPPKPLTPGYMPDDLHVCGAARANKALHKWQQPPIYEPILRFAPEGGLVLDPFMGSGTTLAAARDTGRKAIGIDIDERACETASRRLAQRVLY